MELYHLFLCPVTLALPSLLVWATASSVVILHLRLAGSLQRMPIEVGGTGNPGSFWLAESSRVHEVTGYFPPPPSSLGGLAKHFNNSRH